MSLRRKINAILIDSSDMINEQNQYTALVQPRGFDVILLLRIPVILIYFLAINALLLLLCVARPFHRNNVYVAGKLYSKISTLIGVKLELRMPESLKSGGPYVFIGNHQNSYDLVTICAASQPGMVTVGKKSLKWIPIFGQVYWLSGNIMIDRGNSGKAHNTLKQTAAKIKQRSLSVWLFPEGTRSYGRGLLPFKTGAFRLAQFTHTPVVMVSVSNLHNKINLNRWNNGTLLVQFSEPEVVDNSHNAKYWAEYFHQKMATQIAALDEEVARRDKAE